MKDQSHKVFDVFKSNFSSGVPPFLWAGLHIQLQPSRMAWFHVACTGSNGNMAVFLLNATWRPIQMPENTENVISSKNHGCTGLKLH